MQDSYFVVDDGDMPNLYEKEDGRNFLSKSWKCESWEDVVDNEKNQRKPQNYHYNVSHGIKPDVENRFNNFVQCVFEYTSMN